MDLEIKVWRKIKAGEQICSRRIYQVIVDMSSCRKFMRGALNTDICQVIVDVKVPHPARGDCYVPGTWDGPSQQDPHQSTESKTKVDGKKLPALSPAQHLWQSRMTSLCLTPTAWATEPKPNMRRTQVPRASAQNSLAAIRHFHVIWGVCFIQVWEKLLWWKTLFSNRDLSRSRRTLFTGYKYICARKQFKHPEKGDVGRDGKSGWRRRC